MHHCDHMRPTDLIHCVQPAALLCLLSCLRGLKPCFLACAALACCRYNSSADIWSFGITMIELATGRPPLARCRSPMRVLMDTINNPAPSLDHHSRGHCYSKVREGAAPGIATQHRPYTGLGTGAVWSRAVIVQNVRYNSTACMRVHRQDTKPGEC